MSASGRLEDTARS